jgi:hypothetical protein
MLGVMDYSLLLGIHFCDREQRKAEGLDALGSGHQQHRHSKYVCISLHTLHCRLAKASAPRNECAHRPCCTFLALKMIPVAWAVLSTILLLKVLPDPSCNSSPINHSHAHGPRVLVLQTLHAGGAEGVMRMQRSSTLATARTALQHHPSR